ncbi:MAG TPA: hypothetical protein VK841_12540 [Polyangiaceae bacterium]|jgi:hypothetical protein|nr:hypothetical protein [Polyangiaceae bacterium]
MNASGVAPLTLAGFEVVPLFKADVLDLTWKGNADMNVSVALKSYLREVDAEVRRQKVQVVHADLHELYFMSSACFQATAAWLGGIAKSAGAYKVTFATHPAHPWQKRSLEAIRRIAPDVVAIT